jgi:hypothetical protein
MENLHLHHVCWMYVIWIRTLFSFRYRVCFQRKIVTKRQSESLYLPYQPVHTYDIETKTDFYMKLDIEDVGIRFLTSVVIKSYTFCKIVPCSPLKVNRRFGRTCHLHFQGRRISQERNQREAGNMQVSSACYVPDVLWCSSETSVHFQRTTWLYIRYWRVIEKRFIHCRCHGTGPLLYMALSSALWKFNTE